MLETNLTKARNLGPFFEYEPSSDYKGFDTFSEKTRREAVSS